MNSQYLQEAFKAFDVLNEEDFNIDGGKVDELDDYVKNDDKINFLDIIDPEAETEDELEDSYVGKVVMDCSVCHSKLFKDHSEVHFEEGDEFANVGEECPFCYSSDGYTILGEIKPYEPETEYDVEVEPKDNKEEKSDDEKEDKKKEESLRRAKSVKRIVEANQRRARRARLDEAKCKKCGRDLDKEEPCDKCKKDANLKEEKEEKTDAEILAEICGTLGLKGADKKAFMKDVKEGNGKKYLKDVNANCCSTCKARFKKMIAGKKNESVANRYNARTVLEAKAKREAEECKDGKCKDDKCKNGRCKKMTEGMSAKDFEALKNKFKGNGFAFIGAVEDALGNDKKAKEFHDAAYKAKGVKEIQELAAKYLGVSMNEALEKLDLETEHDVIHVEAQQKEESSDEMLAPLSPETESELDIDANMDDDMDADMEDNGEENEDTVDFDVDDFDEDSFDDLGESYLKKVYENVNSFRTSGVRVKGNTLVVEGIIKFNSGKSKKTSFKFESKDATRSGKVRFIGENLQISRGKKSFTLAGKITNARFVSESLNYNYRQKTNEGKSTRVYGTVRLNESKKPAKKSAVKNESLKKSAKKSTKKSVNK